MADINALLAQGVTPIQLESPVNQFAKLQALRSAQQEQQLNALKLQETQNAMGRQEAVRNYMANVSDLSAPEVIPHLLGLGPEGTAVAKNLTEQAEAATKAKTAKVDLANKKVDFYANQLKNIDTPEAAANWVVGVHNDEDLKPHYDALGATTEKALQTIPNVDVSTPEGKAAFDQWKLRSTLGAKDFAEHLQQQATFGQQQATAAETHRHNVAMEGISKDRADAYTSHMKDLGLNSKSYPNLAQAIADGRLSPTRVNSRNAGIIESALQINPDADINSVIRSAVSGEAGARTLGTTVANQAAAGEEAATMIPIARQYANIINAGQFKTLNDLSNFAAKQTGDTNIVRLNTALNSLVNSYARAISPKGVPTVSDKNHAREILDAGLSKGQLNSTLDVMEQEIAAARAGTESAKAAVISGKPATAPAAGTPDHIQSLVDKYTKK